MGTKRRVLQRKMVRARNLSGGLLVKADTARMDMKFARDAKNLRFSSGTPETRPGSVRVATLPRNAEALSFPGTAAAYLKVPRNKTCPLWTGLGPDFVLRFVERPVSLTPFPGPSEAVLFSLGSSGPEVPTLEVYSTDGLDRRVRMREDGEALDIDEEIGAVEDTGGSPDDRRYFYHISREGQVLRTLMVGAAAGEQSSAWPDAFSASDTKLEAAALDLFIGGYGLDGSTPGLNSILDEIVVLNRYEAPNRRYYWTAHPMLEDPDLLLRLGFDVNGASDERDDSLYQNTGERVGAISRTTGEVRALAVGQFVGEVEIGHTLHRLAMGGGACYREAVR